MLDEQFQNTLILLQSHPALGIAALAVLGVLFFIRPQEMFKLVGFCLFLAVVFYVLFLLIDTLSSGSQQKDTMINKSRRVIEGQ